MLADIAAGHVTRGADVVVGAVDVAVGFLAHALSLSQWTSARRELLGAKRRIRSALACRNALHASRLPVILLSWCNAPTA